MNQDRRVAQAECLRELQEVDFALVELNLYLDTHPYDQQAIEQFNCLSKTRRKMVRRYEKYFGPLYNFGLSSNRAPDGWSKGPWPWEI
jgi:spore coat protein JB